ncbi:MAG: threonine synthase [Dehalococcoidia bacterium]|nr:threonine synthase [Dehalococcoidia bacterium]MDD5493418.1 threonine synthase [Dehalococcoidia bacterium]
MIKGVLQQHREYLPITPATPMISLGEGDTPLVKSVNLARELGVGELYFKLEGCNPTGSFKDRGMVVAMAKAIEAGSKQAICASTGNTSASAAAYGARFGLKVTILVPKGKIAVGKMAQAIAYGAEIIAIEGNFDQALKVTRILAEKHPITLVNSLNPFRIEGQKTSSFEIIDDLGYVPDYLFLPVGNAGNITAYWKGFKEWKGIGKVDKTPVMMGFQAEGAAPIVKNMIVENPQTIATAIRIGNPASWKSAVAARDESGGIIDSVTDDEILAAYKLLAGKEGVFGEPASAAPLAGLIKLVKQGKSFNGKKIVCIITGNGLKDPDIPTRYVEPFPELPADLDVIEKHLGLK